jgi:hypothetical protein
MDRILIDVKQTEELSEWAQKNWHVFDKYFPCFKEVEIRTTAVGEEHGGKVFGRTDYTLLTVKDDGKYLHFAFTVDRDNTKWIKFRRSTNGDEQFYELDDEYKEMMEQMIRKLKQDKFMPEKGDAEALMRHHFTNYMLVNAYIYHCKDSFKHTEVKDVTQKRIWYDKDAERWVKQPKSVIVTHIWRMDGKASTYKVPQAKVWRMDCWGVRGHSRVYKSGKVVHINPYVKGKNKENWKGREYIVKAGAV